MVSSATGVTPFARATLHVGEVRLDGAKMAKSTGNLVLVDDLLGRCSPAALRLAILDRAHDVAWEFVPADLERAEARLAELYSAAGAAGSAADPDAALHRLREGLDVPGALDVALAEGGEVARRLIAALRLG